MDVQRLEEVWAARTGARGARLVAASHVPAALSLLGIVRPGDCLVAFADDFAEAFAHGFDGCDVELVGDPCAEAFAAASEGFDASFEVEGPHLWWFVNSIGGFGLRVPDLRALGRAAREAHALLVVDNTVASAFGCDPLRLGAALSLEALDRVLHSDFLSHNDNVFRDLTIDRALELNDDIEIQPNVYYFSYAGDKTRQSALTGERTSAADMTPLFVPFANQMCSYYNQTTAGGFQIDKSWAPNDGLVNTVSALYPTNSAGKCLTKSGQTGYIQRDGYSNVSYQPGVWNVMPVRHYDHGNFIAGMPVPDLASQSVTALRQFYLSWYDKDLAGTLTSITLVMLSAITTVPGWYQKLAAKAGAGTLVPITGFANSVVSPAVEFKAEGWITGVGAKIFTIAGPVLAFGTLASWVWGLVYWAMNKF